MHREFFPSPNFPLSERGDPLDAFEHLFPAFDSRILFLTNKRRVKLV